MNKKRPELADALLSKQREEVIMRLYSELDDLSELDEVLFVTRISKIKTTLSKGNGYGELSCNETYELLLRLSAKKTMRNPVSTASDKQKAGIVTDTARNRVEIIMKEIELTNRTSNSESIN